MDVDVDVDEIAQVNVVNHDTTPFSDAEINTVPSLPEIKEDEPLPKDLQELVDRCTQLSETEKQELAKVLRKHHDIFAKDNTTFERKQIRVTNSTITVNWTKVVPDGMSPTDIRKAQLLDPDIMPIMVAVQDQKKPEFQEIAENSNKTRSLWFQFNSLVIEGGVLYRKFEHPSGLKEKEELQLILPTKLDRENWPKYLPFIAQAYRNLPHSSHKFSPYEVMFGAAMRSPLDAERGSPPKNVDMHKLYPMWVRKTMQDIHEVVADMNKKAAKRMKAYYDRNATLSPFLEGDLVYLYYPRRVTGISAKLTTRWEGPYKVVNLINDCNARIERVDNPSKKLIVHIDRLARCPAEEANVNKQDDMRNA
ncbi:Retrovirus-related Pol polyprotein from transposon 412, partial [Frankliniella fusca]